MAKKDLVKSGAAAAIVDWNDPAMIAEIKAQYGANLSPTEWNLFLGIGKATGLNPFLREIWAIKYGTAPATVFVGRDGYRRSAQAHPEYEYHYSMAVYANDSFSVKGGVVDHDFKPADRGEIVGAYCVVKRKSSAKEAITYIRFSEYYAGHKLPDGKIKQNSYGPMKPTLWDTKESTMACKVAEAQGLRGSFQELFAGTYSEGEAWEEESKPADAAAKPDPMAPAPNQTALQDDGTVVVPGAQDAPAPAAPAKRGPGRPAKPAAPVVDVEANAPKPAAPAPSAVKCTHLNVAPVKNTDGSTKCPKCGVQMSGPTPPRDVGAPAKGELGWIQTPGSKFDKVFPPKAPIPANAPPTISKPVAPAQQEDTGVVPVPPGKIRVDQTKKLHAVWGEYCTITGLTKEQGTPVRKEMMQGMFGVESSIHLNEDQVDDLIAHIQNLTAMAKEHLADDVVTAENATEVF